ncbi:MAG TPA: MarR family transcriptional regulator [Clostridia bacterium]|nr:MarR family transcriptional regulator [Clostridia bacterium]HRU41174.1 MarR family transcriptional regulator [Candidatus Diapherotrites archaeon]
MNVNKTDKIPDEAMIFGLLLIISNKMNTLLEREFKELDVTTKQWFLSETIKSLFDSPPTIKEVGTAMGSSHQNVKQVALKLQEKGLLTLERDKKDARVTRLRMTEKSYDFWKQTDQKGSVFRRKMFKGLDTDDIAGTRHMLEKLLSNLAEIENAVIDDENI